MERGCTETSKKDLASRRRAARMMSDPYQRALTFIAIAEKSKDPSKDFEAARKAAQGINDKQQLAEVYAAHALALCEIFKSLIRLKGTAERATICHALYEIFLSYTEDRTVPDPIPEHDTEEEPVPVADIN